MGQLCCVGFCHILLSTPSLSTNPFQLHRRVWLLHPVVFCSTPHPLHFYIHHSVLLSIFHSIPSHVYITKSTLCSYLRSTPLIRLDFIYVMFLSSLTPWSLLSIPCHTKRSSYLHLYLSPFILTYVLRLLLLTSPLLCYSACRAV